MERPGARGLVDEQRPSWRSTSSVAALLLALASSAAAQVSYEHIALQAHTFDPLYEPLVPAELASFPSATRPWRATVELFQRTRPPTDAFLSDLALHGSQAIGYIGSQTNLVVMDARPGTSAPPIRHLRWRGPYLPCHRLTSSTVVFWRGVAPPPLLPDGSVRITAGFLHYESPSEALPEILALIPGPVRILELIEPDRESMQRGSVGIAVTPGAVRQAIEVFATTAPVAWVDMR